MKRTIYTILENDEGFALQLLHSEGEVLLNSIPFSRYSGCQEYLQTLKVHLCFHSNFYKTKTMAGKYGFQIRTCWDDLIASSIEFDSREERDQFMNLAFDANKKAVFIDKPLFLEVVQEGVQSLAQAS